MSYYTQTLLQTNDFTHRRFYTRTLLHTDACTHKSFDTQTLAHTCSETSLRIGDVECIGRAKNTPVKPNRRNEKTCGGHQLRLKSLLMRPGAPPESRRYVYTGPGEVSSLVTDPPGTPVTPCKIRSFTSIQMVHTHTPRNSGADEMKMKVKWKWKWNENYLTRTRRGERKRRGKEQTPTQHT